MKEYHTGSSTLRHTPPGGQHEQRIWRDVLAIGSAIFVVQLLMMAALKHCFPPLSPLMTALGESLLLSVVAVSLAYRFIPPAHRQLHARMDGMTALADSTSLLGTFINAVNTGIALHNTEGEIVQINPAACEILGLPPEDLLGHTLPEAYWRAIHENGTPFLAEDYPVRLALQSGQPQTNTVMGVFHAASREYRWLLINAVPLIEPASGQPSMVVASYVNFTERILTQEQLRESEERYRLLIENSPDVTWTADTSAEMTFLSSNAGRIFGWPADEALPSTMHWLHSVHPEDQSQVERVYTDLFARNLAHDIHYRLQCRNGSWIWVHDRAEPTMGANGLTGYSGVVSNVTATKEAEHALRVSESRFRLLAERSFDAICLVNLAGVVTYCSPAGQRLFGIRPEEMVGRHLREFIADDEYQLLLQAVQHDTEHGALVELPLTRTDGEHRFAEASATYINDEGNVLGIQAVLRDITDRRFAEEQLRYQAYHDTLTGLPNRALFEDRLWQALATCRREKNRLALLFIDLDRFKNVNDTLGHQIGDHLLQQVAQRLRKSLREEDTIARIGGDEFLILMPRVSGEQDAAHLAEKILRIFHEPFHAGHHRLTITPSLGINLFPEGGAEPVELLRNADIALYRAKQLGRNSYYRFNPATDAEFTEES